MDAAPKYEITQSIAVLSTEKSGWTKELNLIAWNGKAPKYDIRSWSPDHQKMGKGVTLSDDSQPAWSKYEAAILLDGYLEVLSGKISRKDAVSRVSHDLRQMAVRQGIAIDGIYRNENGIHFQIKSMESAWHGHTVSKPATRLFSDVVAMYRDNRSGFDILLSEAKAMVAAEDSLVDAKNPRQPSWNKYEAAILLDGYLESLEGEVSRSDIVRRVSRDLRQMAVSQGISIDSVFRNEKGISSQILRMESAYQGRTVNLPATELFSDVVDLYRNHRPDYEDLLTEAKSRIEKYSAEHAQELSHKNYQDGSVKSASDDTEMPGIAEQNTYMLLKYPTIGLFFYSYTQPFDVEFEGRHFPVNNWKQTYIQVVRCIFEKFPDKIHALVGKSIRGHGRTDVSDDSSLGDLCKPGKIAENLYLETNESADVIVKKIGLFLDICAIDKDKVTISYYPNKKKETTDGDNTSKAGSRSSKKSEFYNVDFTPYREILSHFPRGFRIASILDMKRFRSFWNEKYGNELSVSDDDVRRYIEHITIPYNNFVYLPEMMLDKSISERLQSYLSKCFGEGKAAVYFDAIYKEFQKEFENTHINNSGMLKSYLAHVNEGKYFIHRNYITATADAEVDPAVEVREYMIAAGLPITKDELKSALSHINEKELLRIIQGSNSAKFVRNQKGEYFHADIIKFTQQEMNIIRDIIQSAIEEKEFIGGKELIDSIEVRLPSINERYPFLTKLGLRDVIAYKLHNEFSFKGKIISTYGQDLSMTDVFAHFASVHEHFTLDQLNSLKLDLNTTIYFDPVYENSLRVSENDFVSRKQARFDIEATDDAISRFCTGDYIALKEISFFGSFPDAGFPWNGFLLEHYTAAFSRKFKLLHLDFTASTPAGAIVRRNSIFSNFNELLSDELAKSNITLDVDNALQHFVEIGLLARRRYAEIERIVENAKLLRAGSDN